jgi:hypothetical protein
MKRELAAAIEQKDWEQLPHELKISLQPDDLDKLLAAAMLSKTDCKERKIWLFDTPDRGLKKAGITLRLRKKKKGGDFTIKVRPVLLDRLQGRWLKAQKLEVEADVVDGHRLLSAAMAHELAPGKVIESSEDAFRPALLTPLQKTMLQELADLELPADKLQRTLPAVARVWRTGNLVIEHWALPKGTEALEVSSTVSGSQLQPTRLWLETLLDAAKVRRAKVQTTKTEQLLKTLQEPAPARHR